MPAWPTSLTVLLLASAGVNLTAYNGALLSGLSNGGVVMGTGADYMTAIAAELR